LQAKPAPELPVLQDLSNLLVESVTLVAGPSLKPVVLTQNPDLLKWLESADDLAGKIEVDGSYQNGGWRLVRRGAVAYQGNRLVFDCIAVKLVAS
jgi:hypothetical protein